MPKKMLTGHGRWDYGLGMSNATDQLALLNGVQSMIIAQANDSGINLAEHFPATEDFKKFVIAFAFQGLRDAGADVAAAFDATLGQGEYDAMFNRLTA
jgi:hypothetical protein